MAKTGREVLSIDTDHGAYDVLPARESDGVPGRASHSVFREDGSLAGYVIPPHRHGTQCLRITRGACAVYSASTWDHRTAGHRMSLEAAASTITECDDAR